MPEDKSKPDTQAKASPPSEESLDMAATAPTSKPATPTPNPSKKATKKAGSILSFRERINIFLGVFLLLVVITGSVVYFMVKPSQTQTTTQLGKLSDKQLSDLKSSATLVGDPKSTLDIQSSTILEGQVLIRSDLSVAGSIKVGNGIILPTITITGSGNFAQLGVSNNLSVGGDTNLQGQLTVSKNLNVTGTANFGNLSVANLTVTSLQLKNDLAFSRHIVTNGGVPGRNVGTAVGSGGTASVNGSDTAGTVNINTGGSPPAGLFITVSFVQHFANTPHVVVTPIGSSAAGIQYYVNRDSNGFSIGTVSAPPASSSFSFDYIVID